MFIATTRQAWLPLMLAVSAVVACDSNPSPLAPDAMPGSRFGDSATPSGATVQGQIEGARGSSASSLRSAMDDDSIMVEVVGTGVMDDVDDDGSFKLEGVPGSLSAMLRISSRTLDTTIRVGEVREDDVITIMLTIVGNDVEVVSATTETDDSPDSASDDDSMDDDSMDDDSMDDDSMDDDSSDDDSLDDDDSDDTDQ